MKTNKIFLIVLFLFIAMGVTNCKDKEEPQFEIYENHDISACGVDDPLRNIEWLREYCESLKKTQNFSSAYIHLYKVIGTDENLFKIAISYSEFDDSPFAYSENWKNCIGEHIFSVNSGVPPEPRRLESFLKDKEFVIELFYFIKQ